MDGPDDHIVALKSQRWQMLKNEHIGPIDRVFAGPEDLAKHTADLRALDWSTFTPSKTFLIQECWARFYREFWGGDE